MLGLVVWPLTHLCSPSHGHTACQTVRTVFSHKPTLQYLIAESRKDHINKHRAVAQLLQFRNNGPKRCEPIQYLSKIPSLSHQYVTFTGKLYSFAWLETVDLVFQTHHMPHLCWDGINCKFSTAPPTRRATEKHQFGLTAPTKKSHLFLPQNQASLAATTKKKSAWKCGGID